MRKLGSPDVHDRILCEDGMIMWFAAALVVLVVCVPLLASLSISGEISREEEKKEWERIVNEMNEK